MSPKSIAKTPPFTSAVPAGDRPASRLSMLARTYGRGELLDTHAHREAQLLFAARGIMQVTTPRGRWLVPPQRAVWLPPRLEHSLDVLADIEMRTLYFEPRWLATRRHPDPTKGEFVVAVSPLLREAILALFTPGLEARRAELLAELALLELSEAEDAATFMPLPTDPRARRVADLVMASPNDPRDLADLARAAGASARTITRLFPAETDLTFKAWRQRARVMAAIELLSAGKIPMKQLAGRLGFSSVAAFSDAFRRVVGESPSAYLGGVRSRNRQLA